MLSFRSGPERLNRLISSDLLFQEPQSKGGLMAGVFDCIPPDEWAAFEDDLRRIASKAAFVRNVPGSVTDIVNSAFESFCSRYQRGNPRELAATTPEALKKAMMFRVWRKTREHLRRGTYKTNGARGFSDIDPTGTLERSVPAPGITEDELLARLREELEGLPKECQETARLSLEGLTTQEIADTLGVAKATVYGYLAQIRIALGGS